MIVYENELEYANRVLSLLGDDYKNYLQDGKNTIQDARLRFLVFNSYFNDIPEEQLAEQIREKFPFIDKIKTDLS
jgi:hypothetical protein